MTRKTGELKRRCWLAKQRLKMGYWESIKSGEQAAQSNTAATAATVNNAVRAGRNAEISTVATSGADEKMYKKVCEILSGDEVTLNPIGQLIERNVYDNLDSAGRQRYIFELSEKFRQLQERYYRERTAT